MKVARMIKKRMNQKRPRDRFPILRLAPAVYLEKLLPGPRFCRSRTKEEGSGLTPRSYRTPEKGQRGIPWVPYWQISRRTGTL